MILLQACAFALRSVVYTMEAVILLRVVCEFFVIKRDSAFMKFIIQVSEPLLIPVRKLLAQKPGKTRMRLDLSPVVAMFILYFISRLLR
ncbi:MAG TPA: YggT family protein [Thermoclostridium caenicola]|uniref:YggT family protein n=1 Tax=Thermoclostridium caenicola TaxID=659425 RepID=A0A1M6G9B9_9FIRM|nr:YggT family protein [Thermoclostridium caenicola]SHJ06533.1 YggT family protein [Thermoclostridium caenicola]HOK43509.1 YggT family protein [Thermoclostridium caenicola]HOL84681.1 YggT family protein [Thermoclostridium caenicola]HOP73100.1 YggT family protein [Thermoclostridium caenicola]HPO76610.1 YggT family protein [Thermoclostridium caenicola]